MHATTLTNPRDLESPNEANRTAAQARVQSALAFFLIDAPAGHQSQSMFPGECAALRLRLAESIAAHSRTLPGQQSRQPAAGRGSAAAAARRLRTHAATNVQENSDASVDAMVGVIQQESDNAEIRALRETLVDRNAELSQVFSDLQDMHSRYAILRESYDRMCTEVDEFEQANLEACAENMAMLHTLKTTKLCLQQLHASLTPLQQRAHPLPSMQNSSSEDIEGSGSKSENGGDSDSRGEHGGDSGIESYGSMEVVSSEGDGYRPLVLTDDDAGYMASADVSPEPKSPSYTGSEDSGRSGARTPESSPSDGEY